MNKKKDPKTLSIVQRLDQTAGQALAVAALSPAIGAAAVTDAYQGNIIGEGVEMDALVETLQASMGKSNAGDLSELEYMLIGQATALQTIFVSLAKRAQHQKYQKHLEGFLGLALKAQAQSRATIQAVIDLKYPRQSTFVKQANIAHGHQQVNNSAPPSRALENQSEQIEVLEGVANGCKEMDARATATPTGGDTKMETVGAVHRPDKRRREGQVSA